MTERHPLSIYVASLVEEGAYDRLVGRDRNPYSWTECPSVAAAWERGWRIADGLLKRRAEREGDDAP